MIALVVYFIDCVICDYLTFVKFFLFQMAVDPGNPEVLVVTLFDNVGRDVVNESKDISVIFSKFITMPDKNPQKLGSYFSRNKDGSK